MVVVKNEINTLIITLLTFAFTIFTEIQRHCSFNNDNIHRVALIVSWKPCLI